MLCTVNFARAPRGAEALTQETDLKLVGRRLMTARVLFSGIEPKRAARLARPFLLKVSVVTRWFRFENARPSESVVWSEACSRRSTKSWEHSAYSVRRLFAFSLEADGRLSLLVARMNRRERDHIEGLHRLQMQPLHLLPARLIQLKEMFTHSTPLLDESWQNSVGKARAVPTQRARSARAPRQ